jgi:hypothetical protein
MRVIALSALVLPLGFIAHVAHQHPSIIRRMREGPLGETPWQTL